MTSDSKQPNGDEPDERIIYVPPGGFGTHTFHTSDSASEQPLEWLPVTAVPPVTAAPPSLVGPWSMTAGSPESPVGQPRYAPFPQSGPPGPGGGRFQQPVPPFSVEDLRRRRRRNVLISSGLFVATFLSTLLVGSQYAPLAALVSILRNPDGVNMPGVMAFLSDRLWLGLQYAVPVMTILLCHEMGHYLQSLRHRIPASLPYFIPLPLPPLGTMGAVIFQGRGLANRRQMFDIAVSGPLAGLAVTLPILIYGIYNSDYAPIAANMGGLQLGEPYILTQLIEWIKGPKPAGSDFMLNATAFAGWVGILITALNLLPVGQLDGGHILYTLIGRRAHTVALLVMGTAIGYMVYTQSFSYGLLMVLLMLTGVRHPPTRDDKMPLGAFRHAVGWLTMAFLLIGFTPTPIAMISTDEAAPPAAAPASGERRLDPQTVDPEHMVRRNFDSTAIVCCDGAASVISQNAAGRRTRGA